MAASAAHGADFDGAAFAAQPYEALSIKLLPDTGPGPCCHNYRWASFSGESVPCPDDLSQPCGVDPLSTEFRDRAGLKRDTYYFLGYQFAVIGVLYLMPESVSSWSDEDKEEYSLSKWWDNVTHPIWDDDDFYLNYIMHPYWGATYFVRARERGYSNTASFWYSATLSAMYEFGAEALFEPVSIQDLIVTPVLGSFVGRYFMNVRHGIEDRSAERGFTRTRDKWVLGLTDPLGFVNRQTDKLFGIETDVQVHPFVQTYDDWYDSVARKPTPKDDKTIGLTIFLRW